MKFSGTYLNDQDVLMAVPTAEDFAILQAQNEKTFRTSANMHLLHTAMQTEEDHHISRRVRMKFHMPGMNQVRYEKSLNI